MAPFVPIEGFDAVEEDWRRLLPSSCTNTVFLTPNWQRVWWRELGAGAELLLLAKRKDGALRGLAPLALRNGTITFLGSPDVCDYLDFVVNRGSEAPFYQRLLEQLDSLEWKTLLLTSIPQDSPTLQYLPELARQRGYQVTIEQEDVVPGVELPATWDEYLGRLDKKDRHELRRKMRRLESLGEVHYYVTGAQADLSRDLEDFFTLMRASREDKDRFLTQEKEGFFRQMAAEMQALGVLRLFFLEVKGVRVASALCFDYGQARLLYNSGFDPEYSYYSVGLLLKAYCLKQALEEGKGYFDFLRGAEHYKYDLGARDRVIYQMTVRR